MSIGLPTDVTIRTDLAPDNVMNVPKYRRGPAELPLKASQWNRVKLILHDATVSIELNDTLVYVRELESSNQRTFGFFHDASVTEARVRNVVMRGDWPKSLPPISHQELADKTTNAIDADLPRLKSIFTHNFQKGGLPEKYFRLPPPLAGSKWTITAEGVEVNSTGNENWTFTEISPRFTLSGDFDIESQFDRLQMECTKRSAGVEFIVIFGEPLKPEFGLNRLLVAPNSNFIYSSRNLTKSGGDRAWIARDEACESMSGRFRLARRGKMVYFLFADGNSDNFRLLDTQASPEVDTERDGIRLFSLCQSTGVINAAWKNLVLRAERMSWYPDPSASSAGSGATVMQPNGQNVRTVVYANGFKAGFVNVGSPEWSSDVSMIAVDMSNGSKPTSHIIVINADGGGSEWISDRGACQVSLTTERALFIPCRVVES